MTAMWETPQAISALRGPPSERTPPGSVLATATNAALSISVSPGAMMSCADLQRVQGLGERRRSGCCRGKLRLADAEPVRVDGDAQRAGGHELVDARREAGDRLGGKRRGGRVQARGTSG